MPSTDGRKYDFVIDTHNLQSTYGIAYQEISKGSKVLDLGCATGNLIELLMKSKGCKVKGYDSDTEAVKIAQDKGLDVEKLDLETEFPSKDSADTYDIVLLLDIIEHLSPYPAEVLTKIKSLLNKNGKLLLSTPNLSHIDVITRMLKGTLQYTKAGILDESHLHFYSPRELITLMWDHGFYCDSIKEILVPAGMTELGEDTLEFRNKATSVKPLYDENRTEVYQYFFTFTLREGKKSDLSLSQHLTSLGFGLPSIRLPRKKRTKWTTVIRYHNDKFDFLKNAIYSVIAQTYEDRSICLVGHTDDTSLSDKASEFIKHFENQIDIDHYTATFKKLRGHPFNVGLDNLNCAYASFLDYDDIYYPHFGQVLIQRLENSDYNFAYGNSIKVEQEKKSLHYKTISKNKAYGEPYNAVKLITDNRIPINTYVYDFEIFKDIRFDEKLDVIEDWDFLLQLIFTKKLNATYVNLPVSEYFIRTDNTNSPLYHFSTPEDIPASLLHARTRIASKFIGKEFCLKFEDAYDTYPDVNSMFPNRKKVSAMQELQEKVKDLERENLEKESQLQNIRSRKWFKLYNKTIGRFSSKL